MTANNFQQYEFSHEKLKLARLASGKSFIEIGELLGVTRQYAHKLEVNAIPSELQINLLAKNLMVTNDYFYIPRKRALELEQCHFRSSRSSTQTLKKMIAAQVEMFEDFIRILEQEVTFPEVNVMDIGSQIITDINSIEFLAEKFRKYLNLGLGPISNITKLAEKMGILVVHIAEADERVDAFSVFNERPLIVRNTAKVNPCRLRFDIGHEIGHLILHQGIETGCRKTEAEANQFASALLMPRIPFLSEFPKMRGRYLNWDALTEMKLRWKVSYKALIYRAGKLGLLSPEQTKTGFTYLARHGFTKTEDYDDKIVMEEATMVQRAINILDYSTGRKILKNSGMLNTTLAMRYLLTVPVANFVIVK